jgi:hypothetical protein
MVRLFDLRRSATDKKVVEVAEVGWHGNPDAPAFRKPPRGSVAGGALADAVYIVIGGNNHLGCFRREYEVFDPARLQRGPHRQ